MRANSKFEKIYRDLLEKIQSGHFAVGQTLPPEVCLAKEYGVAVLTLRRALARLREDGLIKSRPRHGSRVTTPGEAALGEGILKTIGLFASAHANTLSHPPTSQVFKGMEGIASNAGYTLEIFFNDASNPAVLAQLIGRLERSHVQGWLIPTFLSDAVRSYFKESRLPVVLMNYPDDTLSGHLFQVDFESVARNILAHLQEQNRANIWVYSLPINAGWLDAIQKAADEKGVSKRIHTKVIDGYSSQAGSEATKELLAAGKAIDAIICADDEIAAGAIQALQAAGRAIPEEISVIGGGDFPISSLFTPSISTVSYPYYSIGRDAARLLIDLVEGIDVPAVHRLFLPKLIVRQSSAVAPGADVAGSEKLSCLV